MGDLLDALTHQLLLSVFSCSIIKSSMIAAQVPYHATSTASLSPHDVRLPEESTVGDLLDALMQQLLDCLLFTLPCHCAGAIPCDEHGTSEHA